jgi:hypothetical protein
MELSGLGESLIRSETWNYLCGTRKWTSVRREYNPLFQCTIALDLYLMNRSNPPQFLAVCFGGQSTGRSVCNNWFGMDFIQIKNIIPTRLFAISFVIQSPVALALFVSHIFLNALDTFTIDFASILCTLAIRTGHGYLLRLFTNLIWGACINRLVKSETVDEPWSVNQTESHNLLLRARQ